MKGKQRFLAVLFGAVLCALAGCKDMFHPEGSLIPPASIRATAASSSSIAVSWSSVEGASDYRLYRATSAGGTYNSIASTSSVSYKDEGLSPNTAYYYKVRVHNSTGDGEFSSVATATTLASSSSISPPSSVSATAASSSSITVSWGSVSGASSYTLYRSTSGYGTYSYVTSASSTSYTDSGLDSNTTYYYKVSASNSSGESSMSSSYGYATTSSSSSMISPPSSVSATAASSSSITVSWGSVSGASSYNVYRSTSGYGTYSYVTNASSTSYTDSGLDSNTTYYYKVSASNSSGESGMSSSYGYATTLASSSSISPPASVSATAASSTSITVSWGSVSDASSYTLYRSTSGYGTYSYVTNASSTSYTDSGLSANTAYYYKVSASNYSGESSMSSSYGYATTTSVGGSVTVPSNLSLAESLTWISNNAVEGGAYTITLNANETIAPQTLYYSGKNVSIALNGGSAERTVSLSSTGSLFTVESGVTLTLGNNVTLQGRSGNTASLVNVNNDSALVMNAGSKITGNTTTSSYGGGGIYVFDSGAFTMEGGEISGNTSSFYGGGVYNNGTFEMSGGEITGNSSYSYYGGGVYNNGTFTMSGGEISGNTSSYGGGVYVGGGTFTMSNGEISGNTASSYGGGVSNGGTFEMSGGEISGNTTNGYGGGVYNSGTFELSGGEISDNTSSSSSSYSYGGGVYNSGTFTMSVGEISGNTASYYGGGVSNGGTFTMSGGEISGNTTNGYGGGVYISSGTFTKQGGTIYGSNASDSLKNIATSGDSYGHAVYVYSGGKIRNTTADSSVNLDNSGNTIGVTYSSVSGGTWTLLDDGRRQSPAITHSDITKSRVSFTSATTDTSIVIQLEVSSESGCDFAFISQLDNSYASYDSGYYSGSLISGESSVTVTIPVPTAGEHFIDIGYRKDGSVNAGSDCAWFKVTQAPHAGGWENGSIKISLQPTPTSPTLSNASLFVNESASFYAESDYASYAWYWNGELIGGEASYTYDLAANSRAPGIYELSVVVTNSAGKTLSARCRVIIRAN